MQQLSTEGIFDNIVDRAIRAAKLDVQLYEEVEANQNLTSQAVAVVVIAAIASGIGSALGAIIMGRGIGGFFGSLILSPITTMIGYLIWAALTYFIGTKLFEGTADYGEMLRAIGYSYAPQVLSLVSFIPCLGWIISLVGSIWSLVAGVIAVRQALDIDTTKAIITVVIGWAVVIVLTIILSVIGIGGAMAFGALGL
jgi:hypothetical protein